MDTEREALMFYQTSFRNVGLYTSISLGLLGYSRFYRDKNEIYNIAFIIISLLFLFCACKICVYLIQDLENINERLDKKLYLEKWLQIPKIILVINIIIGIFGLYTLMRELKIII